MRQTVSLLPCTVSLFLYSEYLMSYSLIVSVYKLRKVYMYTTTYHTPLMFLINTLLYVICYDSLDTMKFYNFKSILLLVSLFSSYVPTLTQRVLTSYFKDYLTDDP